MIGYNLLRQFWVLLVFTSLSAPGQPEQTIQLKSQSSGRMFDGLGGVSAGASSRLLYDYPEPQRSRILNYLFKPGYGASLQILKVEIGGDMNSTDGSEASHMRSREDLNCDRGYEWWLMKEAKARNPGMIFMALEWGVPAWMQGGFWSDDNISYILKWLDCAAAKGLNIQYIGGWNERRFNTDWYVKMSAAVKTRYPKIRVIASDDAKDIWEVASVMATNAPFRAAVDVVGVHSACGWRTGYEHCPSTPEALGLNKPLWVSESSALAHDVGAKPLARALPRMYLDGKLTAYLCWPPVCGWYADLHLGDTGLILASWPWSGYYEVGQSIWVYAHLAQFAQPGWRYLDESCGYLKNGGSYVALKSNKGEEYTVLIETADATNTQHIRFVTDQGLSTRRVHLWQTKIGSQDPRESFAHSGTIKPQSGEFELSLEPGYVYTLSTTSGQKKGSAVAQSTRDEQMPLPFREDFEKYAPGKIARFFSDMAGGFEAAPCAGGRSGLCYRQSADKPIAWTPRREMPPTTLAGDPRWWGDYEFGCDVFFENAEYVELMARVSNQRGSSIAGYHLRLHASGKWELYSQEVDKEDASLASGSVSPTSNSWHRVALRLSGEQIEVLFHDRPVARIRDGCHTTGQIGLRTAVAKQAQFDNITVVQTGPEPKLLPHSEMRASATSDHAASFRGWSYGAGNAIDGHAGTSWSTDWVDRKPALPQAITLELKKEHKVAGLLYRPRLDTADGRITRFRILLSTDGKAFREVAEGQWQPTSSTKTAEWPLAQARFIRLEALEGVKGMASAGEIDIAVSVLSPVQ